MLLIKKRIKSPKLIRNPYDLYIPMKIDEEPFQCIVNNSINLNFIKIELKLITKRIKKSEINPRLM